MERLGLERSHSKSGLGRPHRAAEVSSHSRLVPWEAERLPSLPGKRKGGCSGVGKEWTRAQLAEKAGGEVRSQQRDPRGPEETGTGTGLPGSSPKNG